MSPPCPQRARFLRNWFEHWSPAERAIVALLSLLVFVTLIVGLRAWSWLAGIFALAFVMALMYYAAWRADMMKADVPEDEPGIKREIMVDTSAGDGKPAEPPAPEKKPPLNDK